MSTIKLDGVSTITVTNTADIDLTSINIVNDSSPQLGGTLDANGNIIDMGTNNITDTKVGQWDTAYGWGDHSTQGYITSADTYTDAEAIAAVEGESTLDLTGQVTIDNSSEPLRITRSSDDHNSVVAMFKDVESGGDLSRRVGTYHAITDGTTTKYLGINNWSDDATNGKQYNIGWLTDNGATTNLVLQATENNGLIVSDDVDMQVNNINEISSLNLNNAHGASRDTEIRSVTGGAGGLVLTTIGSGQDGRPSRIFLQQKNGGGTELGGVEQRFTYNSTEANKKFDVRVYSDDYSSNKVVYEVNGLGDTTTLRSNNINLRNADGSDMFLVREDSDLPGGSFVKTLGQFQADPQISAITAGDFETGQDYEILTAGDTDFTLIGAADSNVGTQFTATGAGSGTGTALPLDATVLQLRADYGSNSVPDNTETKFSIGVRNTADGATTLGRFSGVYDDTAADRHFKLGSPSGDNSMRFYDSKTEFEGAPVRFTRLTTTEINALTAEAGMVVYNNTTNKLQCYNGTSWNDLF